MAILDACVGCGGLATLQVFPAAGGHTVEHMLYASPRLQTVAGCPPETPRWPCHRRTWTTRLARGREERRMRHVADHLKHQHVLRGSAPSYLLSSWPIPRSDPKSWSGLGAWAPPAGHSSRCCWSPSLQHRQAVVQTQLVTQWEAKLRRRQTVFKKLLVLLGLYGRFEISFFFFFIIQCEKPRPTWKESRDECMKKW